MRRAEALKSGCYNTSDKHITGAFPKKSKAVAGWRPVVEFPRRFFPAVRFSAAQFFACGSLSLNVLAVITPCPLLPHRPIRLRP
jgi:hypothetical protein